MSVPLACLLAFTAWTVALVAALAAVRSVGVLRGQARPVDYTAGVPHGSDRYWRLNRAHSNCVEFLPLFAAVVLTGAVLGMAEGTFATLACVILAARIGQSLTHVASGSSVAVNVRFTFFAVQVASLVAMGVVLTGQA